MASSLLSLSVLALAATVSATADAVTAAPTITARAIAPRATTETTSPLPLTDYTYAYSDIHQVNPYAVGRGPQSGYNLCNSTTEGPDSQCQTAIINTIDDFCLWGAPGLTANGTIGDVEAAVVAYCTKSGHGTRIMPAGTITALQFMRTSAYIQVVGLLNQTGLNLAADDTGGELDPHGADQLGNPLGGLVYSTNLDGGDNTTEVQATSWNNFVGSDTFCFKLCYNNVTSPNYCQNIYDLIGCSYNAPAAYTPNLFVACDGDLQDEVGTYTSDGATYTWSQPSSLAADTTLPWTPRVPASSNCVTYQSSDLFPASDLGYQNTASTSAATSAVTTASGAAATSGASSAASSRSGSSSSTATKTSGTTAATSTASAASTSSTTSGSSTLVVSSGFLGLVGLFAMLL